MQLEYTSIHTHTNTLKHYRSKTYYWTVSVRPFLRSFTPHFPIGSLSFNIHFTLSQHYSHIDTLNGFHSLKLLKVEDNQIKKTDLGEWSHESSIYILSFKRHEARQSKLNKEEYVPTQWMMCVCLYVPIPIHSEEKYFGYCLIAIQNVCVFGRTHVHHHRSVWNENFMPVVYYTQRSRLPSNRPIWVCVCMCICSYTAVKANA